MKFIEPMVAAGIGSLLAIIFATPKSFLDGCGRIGVGVFCGYYFGPLVALVFKINAPEAISGISAAMGLFGFFLIEALIRIINNIKTIKDIKG